MLKKNKIKLISALLLGGSSIVIAYASQPQLGAAGILPWGKGSMNKFQAISTNGFKNKQRAMIKQFDSNFIRAAYIDATAIGALAKVEDKGYQTPNVLIFGFADIDASKINDKMEQAIAKATNLAANGTVNLLSVGGGAVDNSKINSSSVDSVVSNVSSQIDNYNKSHSIPIDGVDLDLEGNIDSNTTKALAAKFKSKGYIVTGAPQVNSNSGSISSASPSNLVLTSGGTANSYQAAITAGLFDALFIQTYNSGGFTIDNISENDPKFYTAVTDALAKVDNQLQCDGDDDVDICIPSKTKVVVGTVANAGAAGNDANMFKVHGSSYDQGKVLGQLSSDIDTLASKYAPVEYAGIMVWATTNDYDPAEPVWGDRWAVPGAFTTTILNKNIPARKANPDPVKPLPPAPKPTPKSGEFIYPDSIDSYQAGTIVYSCVGDGWYRYQCKSWPYSPWCKLSKYDPSSSPSELSSQAWDKLDTTPIIAGSCPTPSPTPAPTPTPSANYTLEVTNNSTSLGVTITSISNGQVSVGQLDYLSPKVGKSYGPATNPSVSAIEGASGLGAHWITYSGGPSGDCPKFNFNMYSHIIINADTKQCEVKQ